MDFNKELSERINIAQDVIYSYLPQEEGKQHTVIEAMNYSVKACGKRLRPIFIMEFCKLFSGEYSEAEPFMAAIECIHTYSLVHDDLPAMDNDELRRGKPTTHIKYGHAIGVLAGDGLLNYAYEIVAGAIIASSSPYKAAIAFDMLSSFAGIYGMVGGQTVDVLTENKVNDKDTLDFIYELKTGALIKASMMIGAVLGGADEEQLNVVEEIAQKVGLAFQIQDDILDLTSTTDELGKPVLSDEKNHKYTYVTLLGMDAASDYVNTLSECAIKDLRDLGLNSEFIEELICSLVDRSK